MLSQLTFDGQLSLDGTMTFRRTLPDEEIFESLAARLRPLLVPGESVFYKKVFKALSAAVDASEVEVSREVRDRLEEVERDWGFFDLESTKVVRYAMQLAAVDGSTITPQVSDRQLAAAWLYGDLVHVDTRGSKSDGMLFPIKERYSASVTYFAHAAETCVKTLDLVLHLRDMGVVTLSGRSLTDEVIVGRDELIENAVAYVGPADGPMPSLDVASEGFPADFRQFTVTELLRQSPADRVQVTLESADGSTVSEYEAAVTRRWEENGRLHWEALVANTVTFEISLGATGREAIDGRFEGMVPRATTNQMKLAEAVLSQQMATSGRIRFSVAGVEFFLLGLPGSSEQQRRDIDIAVDALEDLAVIESATGRLLQPLTGTCNPVDRVRLRRTRLLWEGRVVPFCGSPLRTTAKAGVLPQVVLMPAGTIRIGDTEVPTPLTCVRHPLMTAESAVPVPNSDPPQEQMELVIPIDEPFLAWAPDLASVAGDEDLGNPTPWQLSHLDDKGYFTRHPS